MKEHKNDQTFNFVICKVEVFLPVEAFNGREDITKVEDFYIEVYFRLEETTVNPYEIIISL